METSSEDYAINKVHLPSVTYFETDARGIVNMQAEFALEADESFLLRKGEHSGAEILGGVLGAINSLADDSLADTLKDIIIYVTATEKIERSCKAIHKLIRRATERFRNSPFSGRKPKELRILCWPREETEAAREVYERLGYSVRHYRDERLAGLHRFYVNEKRYCLFVRTHEHRFVGVIGTDSVTISKLRETFEAEWKGAKEPPRKAK